MNKKLLKTLFGILFAVVSVALATWLFRFEFFQSLELKAYDAMLDARGEREHTNNVVIVKIDEYTMKELDYPVPRDKYGTLLAIIAQSGATVIGVDDLFPTTRQDSISQAQNDQFLLFHNYAPNVYHAIGPFVPSEENPGEQRATDNEAYQVLHQHSIPARGAQFGFPKATYIDERPYDSLANLAAGIGHVLLHPDPVDGIIRAVPFFVEFAGDYYPTFGAALAFAAAQVDLQTVTVEETETGLLVRAGQLEIPLSANGDLQIDYA